MIRYNSLNLGVERRFLQNLEYRRLQIALTEEQTARFMDFGSKNEPNKMGGIPLEERLRMGYLRGHEPIHSFREYFLNRI